MTALDEITIYVGMALTEAPAEFREGFQKELKAGLRELPNVTVLDFVGLENGTPHEVYLHDRKCTTTADLCVFVVDYPSTGLGIEIALREQKRKPSLHFAGHNRRVTRMLLGLLESKPAPLYRYDSVQDIIKVVQMWLLNHSL